MLLAVITLSPSRLCARQGVGDTALLLAYAVQRVDIVTMLLGRPDVNINVANVSRELECADTALAVTCAVVGTVSVSVSVSVTVSAGCSDVRCDQARE